MDINTCFATTESYHAIAYYSHLVPVFITFLLIGFVLIKSKFSFLSKIFTLFSFTFCLWLIGDVVIWTSSNYNLVSFIWSTLDYINVLFYIFGAYFFVVLIKGEDISVLQKLPFLALTVPAWWIVASNQSIELFYQPYCEAFNNTFLTEYKLALGLGALVFIFLYAFFKQKSSTQEKKPQIWFVAAGIGLFFAVFGLTEYISSITGVYEINLYSLFVLPVFLFVIIYSITNLQLFKLKILGTQLLAYVMIIMVGSQFFFLQDSSERILTIITFVLSLSFGVVLAKDARKEFEQRRQIEILASNLQKTIENLGQANARLKELDRQKTEFVSFATHQLRSPLTAMKGYASLILEGDYGEISADLRDAVEKINESAYTLTNVVNDYLNVSRMELGTMKYDLTPVKLNEFIKGIVGELKPNIDKAGLTLDLVYDSHQKYIAYVDPDKFKQVISNMIDNAIKYTPKGSITLSLEKDSKKGTITVASKDTGIGIAAGVIPKLFEKFSRAESANKINIRGTGLGLFVAKQIVEAHNGKMWVESEGEGKGSQFYVEIPAGK